MNFAPLGDRILIRPDKQPTQTASGLVLLEKDTPEHSGVVMSVGACEHPDAAQMRESAEFLEDLGHEDIARLLRRAAGHEASVDVGDHVLFTASAGQELTVDGVRYILMRDAEILAVVETV